MIRFQANGTQLGVAVETGADCKLGVWLATFDAAREASACVMADYLTDRLERIMTSVRVRAYEQGWKDARAKNRKQCAFSCRLPDAPETRGA